jgi:polar amino acid transport system substrate-binding protein
MKGVKFVFIALILATTLHVLLSPAHIQAQENQQYTKSQQRLISLGFRPDQEESYQDMIIRAQKKLKELGYYTSGIDGIIGPKTTRALMGFQHDLDLSLTGELDAETNKYLSKVTLILNTQDFAPFHYQVATIKNQVFGPVPEAIRATCIEADINCILRLYDWGEAQELVKQDKAHGMFVIGWNADRAKWLHRSMPIIETEYGVFVRHDTSLAFKQPSDLNGYTVGVYGPSNTSTSLSTIQNTLRSSGMTLNVKEMKDDKPLFKELSASEGKYAVYSNKDVGETIINGLDLDNIQYAGTHKKLLYYIGFSQNLVDQSIVDRFNKAFVNLQERGVVQEIYANSGLRTIQDNNNNYVTDKKDEKIAAVKPESRYQVKLLQERELIEDVKTCLTWQKHGSTAQIDWNEAKTYIEMLNTDRYAGYADWRIPDLKELSSLLEGQIQKENRLYISALFDPIQYSCWSNNGVDGEVQFIDFYEGVSASKNELDTNYVRAVRGKYCGAVQ